MNASGPRRSLVGGMGSVALGCLYLGMLLERDGLDVPGLLTSVAFIVIGLVQFRSGWRRVPADADAKAADAGGPPPHESAI